MLSTKLSLHGLATTSNEDRRLKCPLKTWKKFTYRFNLNTIKGLQDKYMFDIPTVSPY